MGSNGHADFAISIGSATNNVVSDASFLSVTSDISGGRWRGQVEELRLDQDPDHADELKLRLPAVLWSGRFSKRTAGALKQHSGLVHVDLDKLGSSVEAWRELIIQDEHTLYCMVSPSGTGLKVVYRCDPARPHLDSFRAAERHMLEHFGLTADPSCKDVSRLCFVSYDPDAFLNLDATPLLYPPAPVDAAPEPGAIHTGLRPGEAYDLKDDWKGVLRRHGWTEHGDHHWTRPGKAQGISATWDTIPEKPRRFFVFTSSTEFQAQHVYLPWHIFAVLECGGDFARASKELYAQGFGDRMEVKKRVPTMVVDDDEPGQNGIHPADSESTKPDTPLRSLSSFALPPDDDSSILLGDRYLSRGDGAILSGTSGIGKSSLAIQKSILWALARPAFGIRPNGPLRSLIFQSEDSDGDVAEIWESMRRAAELSDADVALLDDRVKVVSERVLRGPLFVGALGRAISAHKPDIVWINPLQAFLDGDITDSQDLGSFLRESLNRLNTPPSFAYILVHHTTKPATGKDRTERLWHEVMYDMAGGAELINWARAILSLRPAAEPGEFNLILAKRGTRAGVTKQVPQGAGFRIEPVTTIPIKHSSGRIELPGVKRGLPVIHWLPREPDAAPETSKLKGRPEKYNFSDYRNLMPRKSEKGLEFGPLLRRLNQNGEIPKGSFQGLLKRWTQEGLIETILEPDLPARFRAAG